MICTQKLGYVPPPLVQEHVPPGPPIAAPSRPDQPSSHVPPTPEPDDPLVKVKVPIFGDQLTRVRLARAKDLRAGYHTPQDRLDHLYPYKIVDWHTKRSFLKVSKNKICTHFYYSCCLVQQRLLISQFCLFVEQSTEVKISMAIPFMGLVPREL